MVGTNRVSYNESNGPLLDGLDLRAGCSVAETALELDVARLNFGQVGYLRPSFKFRQRSCRLRMQVGAKSSNGKIMRNLPSFTVWHLIR